jgi:pyruvate formate lyase activating enzyme
MVFCSGCNFHCPFCANSSLVPANSGVSIRLNLIKERVTANIGFLDAIGFTGGEPSLQPQPVIELCQWAKTEGLKVFINTNGSKPEFINRMVKHALLDYIAIDVKAPFTECAYSQVSGIEKNIGRIIENIMKTIKLCENAHIPTEIRTTIVPTLIDDERSIHTIAGSLQGRIKYVLQEFFPFKDVLDKTMRKIKPPSRQLMVKLAKVAVQAGLPEVYIRMRETGMELITFDG